MREIDATHPKSALKRQEKRKKSQENKSNHPRQIAKEAPKIGSFTVIINDHLAVSRFGFIEPFVWLLK